MASRKNEADDAGLPRITLGVEPYSDYTVITVVVSHRRGRERVDSRLARWHIRLTRADLAGHSTDDVLLAVLGMVVQRIEQQRTDAADWHATRRPSTAVGPGTPGGGHGGGTIDVPLPGLEGAPPSDR